MSMMISLVFTAIGMAGFGVLLLGIAWVVIALVDYMAGGEAGEE